MHLLLIHQNFPGQFRELAPAWLAAGHRITAIGSAADPPQGLRWQGLRYVRYAFDQEPSAHERGLAVARLCRELLQEQDHPDLVLSHSGWGEALLLRRALGPVPWISYPELWGTPLALGFGFDPDLEALTPKSNTFSGGNLLSELAILQSDAAVVASRSQMLSFPEPLRRHLRLIPEGVDLNRLTPDPKARLTLPDHGLELMAGQPLVTFISREMEPLRGLRQLLRAWPSVSHEVPTARLLLVGGDGPGYSLEPPQGLSHLEDGLANLPQSVDRNRIHHLGRLAYGDMLRLLQCSAAHLALSYPYTLSWSVLEAMACGAPLISNIGSPIAAELESGLDPQPIELVAFHDTAGLAGALIQLLQEPRQRHRLGDAGRTWLQKHFDLTQALSAYEAMFQELCQQELTDPGIEESEASAQNP